MKILIVDDELLERKAMRKMIIKHYENIEVVGEAENGRKAVELAHKLKPHIIFMDIKMPGMTGLEASEKIYEAQPHIKIVLVSAYDTFEYAKQAMQYGIKDYILKPGQKAEVIITLNRMIEEVNMERRSIKNQQETMRILKESLVMKVIRQQVDEKTNSLLRFYYPQLRTGYFIVFSKGKCVTEKMLEKVLYPLLEEKFILVNMKNAFVCLIVGEEEVSRADQLILAKKLSTTLGGGVYLGVGASFSNLKNARVSYENAYAACFYYKANEKSHYGFFSNAQNKTKEEIMSSIVQEVENGHKDLAMVFFKKFTIDSTKTERERLYILLQTALEVYSLQPVEMPISTLHTEKDWHAFLKLCCMKMSTYHQSRHSMQIAKQYIEKHFKKSLTLEEVALEVKLSPTYFSKIFKEYYQETFIEYVTRIRMEEARKLIRNNEISIKEISYLIGYNDPNYFSRVFKKHYGYPPRQLQRDIIRK